MSPVFLSCSSSFYPQRDSLATSSTTVQPPCFGSHFTLSLWFSRGPCPVLWPVPSHRGPSSGLPACIPLLGSLQPQSLLPTLSLVILLPHSRGWAVSGPGPLFPCWCLWNSFPCLLSVPSGRGSCNESARAPQHSTGRLLGGLEPRPGPWGLACPLRSELHALSVPCPGLAMK